MIRINDLIKNIRVISVTGEKDPVIKGIEFDSRKVSPGTLFVAVRGTRSDGHDFIGKAVG